MIWEAAYGPIGKRTDSTAGTAAARYYCTNGLNQYAGLAATTGCPPNPSEKLVYDLDGNLTGTGLVQSDHDNDGDVDLEMDYGYFGGCFNGSNRPLLHAECEDADFDNGADVDLSDFGVFRRCLNSSNKPPAQGCPDYPSWGPSEFPPVCLEVPQVEGMAARSSAMVVQPMAMESLEGVDVTFALDSPQAGQTITAGTYVEWHASVSLTGVSQGLGGWDFSLFLGPDTGPGPGYDGIWGTEDDDNLSNITLDVAAWSEAFAVTGANGKPTAGADVTVPGNGGGPGMDVMTSDGVNEKPGTLLQVGASHLTWDPWRYQSTGKNPGWYGEHTWGVGLDDRKEALLLNTSGSYELNSGSIDTTNLAPGHYVLTLVSSGLIDVLRPDADLTVLQDGNLLAPASSVNGPVSIEFDIDE